MTPQLQHITQTFLTKRWLTEIQRGLWKKAEKTLQQIIRL